MLSWIASDLYRNSPFLIAPIIALLLLLSVFLAVSLRALLTSKKEINRLTQLPLEDGDD